VANHRTNKSKVRKDKHQKRRAGGEKAKKRSNWIDMGKKTNSKRNKSRKSKGIIDTLFGL
jgi:hypothetical protein